MPGPRSTRPSRFTFTAVPRGNTVSRCALSTTLGRACGAGPLADDVAFGVDPHVLEPGIAQHLRVHLRAPRLLKRRRLDLAQTDLIFDDLQLGRARRVESRPDRRLLDQHGAEFGRALLGSGRGSSKQKRQDENSSRAQHAAPSISGDLVNW